jgi:HPt (histidine-containing phosphotransfer) domain-containing protein
MIFMDIQMPVMDGFQATRAIRELELERGGHIPIVAMTAYAASGDRQKCLDAGMDSYVSKPVMPAAIISAINSYAPLPPHEPTPVSPLPDEKPAPEAITPVFDRDALLNRLAGKSELVPRFTSMYIDSVTTGLENLRKAILAGNADDVHRQAHTIKGASANIGAERVRGCAIRLDELARSGEISGAPELLNEIETEFEQFRQVADRVQ